MAMAYSVDLIKEVNQALKSYRRVDRPDRGLLSSLFIYQRALQSGTDRSPRQITDDIITKALGVLRTIDEACYDLLRLRYGERNSPEWMMERLHFSSAVYYRKQREAIAQLTEVLRAED